MASQDGKESLIVKHAPPTLKVCILRRLPLEIGGGGGGGLEFLSGNFYLFHKGDGR